MLLLNVVELLTQRAVLVPALEGRDIIARAKTGTGKTLAFGIPIIKQLTAGDEGRNLSRLFCFFLILHIWRLQFFCIPALFHLFDGL